MIITKLDWDSKFFGMKIGQICCDEYSLKKILATLKKGFTDNFNLIYLQIPALIDKEEILHPYLVDRKVIYEKEIKISNDHCSESIQEYTSNVTCFELIDLAYQSGNFSRFKSDSNFKEMDYRRLYKQWIVKSVEKKIADVIFVYKKEKKIKGMITLKIINNTGIIGLIAVDSKLRGMKIGSNLLTKVEKYLLDNGINRVEVATQFANKSACDFYIKNNYRVKKKINYYHIWYKYYENTI